MISQLKPISTIFFCWDCLTDMQIVNAKLRGTTPIGLTLDPQNNEPLIPRLRCHVAVAEYEGIEESKKTLYCTY